MIRVTESVDKLKTAFHALPQAFLQQVEWVLFHIPQLATQYPTQIL